MITLSTPAGWVALAAIDASEGTVIALGGNYVEHKGEKFGKSLEHLYQWVKKFISSLAIILKSIIFGMLNAVTYIFAFGVPINSYLYYRPHGAWIDFFCSTSVDMFMLAIGLNALIQNFSFDKKFIPIFKKHKEMVTDMLNLPSDWLIRMSVMKSLYYSTAILLMVQRRKSYAPIVNYLTKLEEFKNSTKWYNQLAAWFLFVSLFVFLAGLILNAIISIS